MQWGGAPQYTRVTMTNMSLDSWENEFGRFRGLSGIYLSSSHMKPNVPTLVSVKPSLLRTVVSLTVNRASWFRLVEYVRFSIHHSRARFLVPKRFFTEVKCQIKCERNGGPSSNLRLGHTHYACIPLFYNIMLTYSHHWLCFAATRIPGLKYTETF